MSEVVCPGCGGPIPPNEAAAYGDRCEDCYGAAMAGVFEAVVVAVAVAPVVVKVEDKLAPKAAQAARAAGMKVIALTGRAGTPIVDLADNDPLILQRLAEQQQVDLPLAGQPLDQVGAVRGDGGARGHGHPREAGHLHL